LPGDLPGWAGPITQVDESPQNFAKTKVEAFDMQAGYSVGTIERGQLNLWRQPLAKFISKCNCFPLRRLMSMLIILAGR